ncbi:MAG: hypothetical protein LUD00_07810 [Prevotellaceae bacterium]|nr:hypothetical protein [Prevotellaceae bacterium]
MKTLFTAFILTFAVNASAKSISDTLTIVRPDSVVFITSEDRLQVSVNGKEENHEYVYHKEVPLIEGEPMITSEHTKEWRCAFPFLSKFNREGSNLKFGSGVCIGWSTAVNAPEGMSVDMGESFEVMWPYILGWEYSPADSRLAYRIGVGVNWRNFRMTGKTRFIKEAQAVTLGEYPENAEVQFSRLKVFSWIVPLTVDYDISDKLTFTFGPVINFNTYSSLKTRYRLDGHKCKDFDKRAFQNRTTVDLFAALHLRSIGVYVKYNPCNVLKSEFAPSFNALSAGFTLFY